MISVLLGAAGSHQGSRTQTTTDKQARQIRAAGLTGKHGGLTRAGSILAERLKSAELDALFGPE